VRTQLHNQELLLKTQQQEREIIRLKKVMVIYKHYRDCGTLYDCYWITPNHLYKYITLHEKYENVSANYNWDTLNKENMWICWASSGFNFKTDGVSKANKNGTFDYGIMDLNTCNLYLFPDKGKGNDKFNMELSIKAWHEWLSGQKRYTCWWMWNAFRPDVKELYWKLQKVKP
jgi:hypothetical protein